MEITCVKKFILCNLHRILRINIKSGRIRQYDIKGEINLKFQLRVQHSRRLFGQPGRLFCHDKMQSGPRACMCVCANISEEHDVSVFRIELKMEELCFREMLGPTVHTIWCYVSEDHNMNLTDMNISNLYFAIFISNFGDDIVPPSLIMHALEASSLSVLYSIATSLVTHCTHFISRLLCIALNLIEYLLTH
jgi:hypothetical protein